MTEQQAAEAGFQAVIGLEVHTQLNTRSKIFCADEVVFGGEPNTRISPVSLGLPGALPTLNRACVEMAVKMGLATGCQIADSCYFARKNYFYPDLPKGYQITQDETPVCYEGKLTVRLTDGRRKTIRIQRIQLEEDAGKSLHDQNPFYTLIDLNRAGTGLIEIVSHPDMTTAEEAAAYLTEIRKIVRYLDVCDGNMEEGSLRCDANISVMPLGATEFGKRVEVKNMNSISNVARAINYEIARQIAAIQNGERITQETRTWDAAQGITLPMREKEGAADYRYFPEPDLLPLSLAAETIERLKNELPELPEQLFSKYTERYGLPVADAVLLAENRAFAAYYDSLITHTTNRKTAANWLLGPVRAWLNEYAMDIERFPLAPASLSALINLVEEGHVSHTAARDTLWKALIAEPTAEVTDLAAKLGLLLENNTAEIEAAIAQVLNTNADKVQAYKSGKTGLLGFFVGQVTKAMGGKADPKLINTMLTEVLNQ